MKKILVTFFALFIVSGLSLSKNYIVGDDTNAESNHVVAGKIANQLEIDTNKPYFIKFPDMVCVDRLKPYSDTIIIGDIDLPSKVNPEELNIELLKPIGFTLNPVFIKGPINDSVKVAIFSTSFDAPRDSDSMVTFVLKITDKAGNFKIDSFRLQMSEYTYFKCPIKVEYSKSESQILTFGEAPIGATSGEGQDGFPIGQLDPQFCEYELDSIIKDRFDARWNIPKRMGTLINIFPYSLFNSTYTAQVNLSIDTSKSLTITWNKYDIPDVSDKVKNPKQKEWFIWDISSGPSKFNYNMRTGKGEPSQYIGFPDSELIQIKIPRYLEGIGIFSSHPDNVNEISTGNQFVTSVSPNPIYEKAEISLNLEKRTDVQLEIYNSFGNQVSLIHSGTLEDGKYNFNWDTQGLIQGMYFLKATYNARTEVKMMIVLR